MKERYKHGKHFRAHEIAQVVFAGMNVDPTKEERSIEKLFSSFGKNGSYLATKTLELLKRIGKFRYNCWLELRTVLENAHSTGLSVNQISNKFLQISKVYSEEAKVFERIKASITSLKQLETTEFINMVKNYENAANEIKESDVYREFDTLLKSNPKRRSTAVPILEKMEALLAATFQKYNISTFIPLPTESIDITSFSISKIIKNDPAINFIMDIQRRLVVLQTRDDLYVDT